MFEQAFNYLGGLLGFGGNPTMPPAGPEYYAEGMAAGAATNPPQAPRPDPFSRFTPEQRQYLGYATLADMLASAGGNQSNAARSLMKAFDVQSGRDNPADLMPAMQQPQQPQFAQAPGLLPMPAPQAPQTRSPMAMNLPRPVAIRVPSLLGR
jgi:hypothetical protein